MGLVLYDVFDHEQRAQGFRWLSEVERAAAKKTAPKWEGTMIKPEAIFFHARIENAKLDCHPQRVRFARITGG